jgi:hypothetical protein
MCDRSHRYTVEHENKAEGARYSGTDRDEAISALVRLQTQGEVGHVTAEHVTARAAESCSEESCRTEDEAIRACEDMELKWEQAHAAFHGAGAYAIENQD